MKATELMIGNWVQSPESGKYFKVETIYGGNNEAMRCISAKTDDGEFCNKGIWQPIPLTPEILEKNGFVNRHTIGELYRCDIRLDDEIGGEYISLNYYLYNKLLSIKLAKDYSTCPSVSDLPIQYVHELQNALTLCKIEKEIEL